MKRSQQIRLILIGTLSSAALSSGDSSAQTPPPGGYALSGNVFTNDHYLPTAGYYHAPYRAWFPLRYNYFDAEQQKYFHGGRWTTEPHQSITNISAPLPQAIASATPTQPRPPAHTTATHIHRSGFGSTSRTWSSPSS